MHLGKRLLIKAVRTTVLLFLIFTVCTCENISVLIPFSVAGGCDIPVSGPLSGSLKHTDEKIIDDSSNMSVVVDEKDFIAEATFYNPYSSSEGKWDYGFLFRIEKKSYPSSSYAVQVAYDGTWKHLLIDGENYITIGQGTVSLQTEADQPNHLRIIVVGNSGAFYVNGQFVTALDTSEFTESGDVRAATGIYRNHKIVGEVTRFEDFTVWSMDIPTTSPARGSLEDKKDGSIEFSSAGVNVKDFIVEATFYNPYSSSEGSWDYGFLFRMVKEDTLYALRVTSDSTWSYAVKRGEGWNTIGQGALDLRTGANQNNRLRIIVIGNFGWFYVDDEFVASLSTSGLTESGDIRIATGIISENEIEGESTRFEDFAVWSLDGCPELPPYRALDRDGDGVLDDKDSCYNPGCTIIDDKGCPIDSDGDGVNDCEDKCPSEYGKPEDDGCLPDRDGDGILDDKDDCYNPECTIVDDRGCPIDSDGDGVNDCEDECLSEYGDPEYSGCPDTDKDGVPEPQDNCYDPECTIVDENGCPADSDGDDVNDCEDECKNEKGLAINNGCPFPYRYIIPVVIVIVIGGIIIQRKRQKKKGEEKAEEKPGKIICPFCKNEVEEDWVSCPYCGIKLKEDTRAY